MTIAARDLTGSHAELTCASPRDALHYGAVERLRDRHRRGGRRGTRVLMLLDTAGHMAPGVLLLIGVVVLIFCLLQLIPGDPIQAMVGDMPVPPALRAALEQRFQLNEPFFQRLYGYLVNVLHGDLGYSMNYRRPVFDILAERFPRTLLVAGVGCVVGILIGSPIRIHSH